VSGAQLCQEGGIGWGQQLGCSRAAGGILQLKMQAVSMCCSMEVTLVTLLRMPCSVVHAIMKSYIALIFDQYRID
jgi:hypothetical protein